MTDTLIFFGKNPNLGLPTTHSLRELIVAVGDGVVPVVGPETLIDVMRVRLVAQTFRRRMLLVSTSSVFGNGDARTGRVATSTSRHPATPRALIAFFAENLAFQYPLATVVRVTEHTGLFASGGERHVAPMLVADVVEFLVKASRDHYRLIHLAPDKAIPLTEWQLALRRFDPRNRWLPAGPLLWPTPGYVARPSGGVVDEILREPSAELEAVFRRWQ